ncbi:MAG: thermonuclease family protein [Planctomycetota bacterium]
MCYGFLVLAHALPVSAGCQNEEQSQYRVSGQRVTVPVDRLEVDDGDTVRIEWSEGEVEVVRILGIDAPELRHVSHDLPHGQAFGRAATGFAKGAFAAATEVELLRADMLDDYGRTLGYLFVNGRNYSVLILRARLAVETVSHYGDNGLPKPAAAVRAAAEDAGPVPFEAPYLFRRRMREVSKWMRETGQLPEGP